MNKLHNELIAAYLAGDDVEQALIQACQQDAELLAELSEQVAFSRIVAFAVNAQDNDQFIKGFQDKLLNDVHHKSTAFESETENITDGSHYKRSGVFSFYSILRYGLAACIGLFSIMFLIKQFYVAEFLGVVAKVANAENSRGAIATGDNVGNGQFSLTRGYAEITLNNGVVLLLEAPVQLTIRSVEHITLAEGSLVARVPDGAEGFQVDTPSSQIIDLGTEFGVSVDKKGKSQVHVLDGEVKVRASKAQQYEHLMEDQARAFNLEQQVAIIENQPQRFMRTLPGKSIQNPDYLHWPLNKQAGDNVQCQGKGINGQCFNAKRKSLIKDKVGPEYVKGKFGDAVFFNGEDDWLESEFLGIGGNKPRTVAFWVKVPRDFSLVHSYGILSWGLADKLSAWQISPNPSENTGPIGRIRIGTNHAEIVGTTDLRDNEWHHVAIVLFGGEAVNLATHVLIYLDGELEKTATKSLARVFTELNHPNSRPLMMGRNMAFRNPQNTEQKFRFFKGWLDEVYIFDSALEQKRIYNLMHFNQLTAK